MKSYAMRSRGAVLAVMVVFALAGAGMAANFYVAPGGDDINDGSDWANANATIAGGVADALAWAGSGHVVIVSNNTYLLSAEIEVDEAMTIRGFSGDPADVIVDGQGSVRGFDCTGINPVTFENITIQNCNGGQGAGIDYGATGDGTVSNCVFIGNEETSNWGGAIYRATAGGDLQIVDCWFRGNKALQRGGAVYMGGGAIIDCHFITNSSVAAGAAWGQGAVGFDIAVSGCTFVSNSASSQDGGALYVRAYRDAVVTNCDFTGNTADRNGGGLTLWDNTDCLVVDCDFTNCVTDSDSGGAIYSHGIADVVVRCTFDSCVVTNGNATTEGGSAIAADSPAAGATLTVSNCVFRNCSGYGTEGHQGAIFAEATDNLLICGPDTLFTNCFSEKSAAAVCTYSVNNNLEIRDATFVDCRSTDALAGAAGVGAVLSRGPAILDACTIRDCVASEDYGGGMTVEDNTSILNCTFDGNSAEHATQGYGGALRIKTLAAAGVVVISNTTFSCNTAAVYGGAIYVFDCAAGSGVYDCTFVSNTVGTTGGAAYGHANMEWDRCTFAYNEAEAVTGSGGGIFGSVTAIRNCLFYGNEAGNDGGAIRNYGTPPIESCTIVGNYASDSGGGVFSSGYATNCIIAFNDAGDANYLDYRNLHLDTCWITTDGDPGMVDCDASNGYGTSHVAGTYTLTALSPCKDTGVEVGWMSGATDRAGNDRILDGAPDIGAYEYYVAAGPQGTVISIR